MGITHSKQHAKLLIKPIVELTLPTKVEKQERNVFATYVIPLDQCFSLLDTIDLQQLQPSSGASPWFMLLKSEIPLVEREKNGQHCRNLPIPTTNRMSNHFTRSAVWCTTWIQSFRAEIHWRINGDVGKWQGITRIHETVLKPKRERSNKRTKLSHAPVSEPIDTTQTPTPESNGENGVPVRESIGTHSNDRNGRERLGQPERNGRDRLAQPERAEQSR